MVPQGLAPGNDPLPQSIAIQAPRCRGVVVAGVAEALAPLFAGLPDTGALELVKRSTVRSVWRGSFGDVGVHLKVFRPATLSDRARDSLRGDRGTREARNLLHALAIDLPAAAPLACGHLDGDDGARSFLVTRSVRDAAPFAFDLPAPALVATGRLLRRAHDRGLLPGDLHPGNVVIDAELRPWLLDLSSLRHAGDPDLRQRAAALAFFCQELDGGPQDHAAEPLLLAYLDTGRPLPEEFFARLRSAARAVRSRALHAFGRRWSRPCRHTVVPTARRGEWRFHLHQVEDEVDRDELHAACREFVASPTGEPLRQGRRGAVWLLDELAVKRREQGAARHLFEAMYWLRFAGVPQPEPVALATRAGTGYVFARRLPMPSVADELRRCVLDGATIAAAARSLGDATGRLHAHGLRNRDLKLENLVRDPVTAAVCMVDLDGVRRKRPGDARGQGADLGRLLAAWRAAARPGGDAAAFAFAKAYLRARERLLQPAPARRLWRGAAQRAREWRSAHPDGAPERGALS
ncbi:MAG: hypothetical protein AB7O97_06740 [Planctomycetota bacterium]